MMINLRKRYQFKINLDERTLPLTRDKNYEFKELEIMAHLEANKKYIKKAFSP